MGGDATEDLGETYEGFETLIAVGTQAGKVLIFNVLGLLIHEIALGISITAVEWVGDMTAASALPTRASSLPTKHCSVVEVAEAKQLASSGEETDTVKKAISPHNQAVTRKPVHVRPLPDLFSDEPRELKSRVPSRRASDISKGSPLRVERTRERPVKRPLPRPRISTETFQSPPDPSSHKPSDVGMTKPSPSPNHPIQESRKWPQVHRSPNVPKPSRAQQFSAPYRSVSSSEESDFSEHEWFTPPSTRRYQEKAPRRHLSPDSSLTASTVAIMLPMRFSKTFPTALDTPSSLCFRPTSCIIEEESVGHQKDVVEEPKSSVIMPKATRCHVTIANPDLSSPFDSPSSLYSRPTAQMFEKPPNRKKRETSASQVADLTAEAKPPIPQLALTSVNLELETYSSVCSCSSPGAMKDTTSGQSVDDIASSGELVMTPQTPQANVLATIAANSSSSLDSLYSPPPCRKTQDTFVQNHNPHNLTTAPDRQLTPKQLDTRSGSPSSAYSRSISGMVKDTNHVDAGIEDTDQSASSNTPKPSQQQQLSIHGLCTSISTSSPTSLYSRSTPGMFLDRSHAVDRPSAEKAKDVSSGGATANVKTVAEEMMCLAEDQRALRHEVAALREECRVLKNVLLKLEV